MNRRSKRISKGKVGGESGVSSSFATPFLLLFFIFIIKILLIETFSSGLC